MRKRIQTLAVVACILSTALSLQAMTSDARAHGHFGNLSFAVEATSAPQTKARKRRATRNKRRATSTQKSNSPTTSGNESTVTTSPASSQGPLAQMAYELPLRKPGTGEQQERGLLTNVACDARGVTFNLTVGARVLKLWTADLNNIHLATYTPDVSGDMTCGPRRPANNVVVIYRPAKEPRAKVDGTLVAVEFVPKNFELKK
jgi:hypothetical protein